MYFPTTGLHTAKYQNVNEYITIGTSIVEGIYLLCIYKMVS
jgi:hypothetical protein